MTAIPKETKVLRLFKEDNSGIIQLLDMPSIYCSKLTVGETQFSGSSVSLGGISFENETIKSNTLRFDIASGAIDFSGASLVNVGSITTDPGFYSKSFNKLSCPAGQSISLGTVQLLTDSVMILIPEIIGSTISGTSMALRNPRKIKNTSGTFNILPYMTDSITVDDPILNNVTMSFSGSGSTVDIIVFNGTPLAMDFKLTVSVTIMTF